MKRLLIIENDTSLAQGLSIVFREEGFDTFTVFDKEEGMQAALNEHFSLIMLGGAPCEEIDLVKKLRDEKITAPALIMFSGEEEQKAADIKEIADCYYLVKPFNLSELILFVKEIFHKKAVI